MLEVTILKTIHSGAEEAKKLRPYIRDCDIFSPEYAYWNESISKIFEAKWREVLKESRNQATKFVEGWGVISDKNVRSYNFQIMQDLYREKKLVWLAERFLDKPANYGASKKEVVRLSQESSVLLQRGNVEDFLKTLRKCYEAISDEVIERDIEIARNIDNGETEIRRSYPELAHKEPIKWFIQIGECHEPEKHVKTNNPKSVDLGSKKEYTRKSVEEITDTDLLRNGLFELLSRGILRNHTAEQIENLSYDQLLKLAEKR